MMIHVHGRGVSHREQNGSYFLLCMLDALVYVVWQKSNETDFLLTMNFILFTNQGYPLQKIVPLGSYTVTLFLSLSRTSR